MEKLLAQSDLPIMKMQKSKTEFGSSNITSSLRGLFFVAEDSADILYFRWLKGARWVPAAPPAQAPIKVGRGLLVFPAFAGGAECGAPLIRNSIRAPRLVAPPPHLTPNNTLRTALHCKQREIEDNWQIKHASTTCVLEYPMKIPSFKLHESCWFPNEFFTLQEHCKLAHYVWSYGQS